MTRIEKWLQEAHTKDIVEWDELAEIAAKQQDIEGAKTLAALDIKQEIDKLDDKCKSIALGMLALYLMNINNDVGTRPSHLIEGMLKLSIKELVMISAVINENSKTALAAEFALLIQDLLEGDDNE